MAPNVLIDFRKVAHSKVSITKIEQVSCDLLAGKLQSDIVRWDDSRAFQRQMAKIRLSF